jgi:hypothetical protein
MKLIDADMTIKNIHERTYISKALSEIFETIIDEQPTAYDVDGVVQKLDEMKRKSLYSHSISFSDEDLGKAFGFEIAIDVVKRGGKSDK